MTNVADIKIRNLSNEQISNLREHLNQYNDVNISITPKIPWPTMWLGFEFEFNKETLIFIKFDVENNHIKCAYKSCLLNNAVVEFIYLSGNGYDSWNTVKFITL